MNSTHPPSFGFADKSEQQAFPVRNCVVHMCAYFFLLPQVLVTQASGLALTALINESPDTRGPEVYVDNIDPFVGVFVTVNLTTFMLVSG